MVSPLIVFGVVPLYVLLMYMYAPDGVLVAYIVPVWLVVFVVFVWFCCVRFALMVIVCPAYTYVVVM